MVKVLEREDYDDRVELEIARRARQALVDHQTSTSLTVIKHPVMVPPHQGVKVLPMTFVGEAGRPAAMIAPSVISQSSQLLPPQGRVLEGSRASAPVWRELLEEDEVLDEEAGLRDLRDNQLRNSRQDMVGSLAAPPFVPAAAQGLVHLPF